MYFLSEEERRLVLRRLLPQSRQTPVAEELRGWNWHQPPLAPVYDVPLGIFEIAGQYCASGRDVYLRRVQGVQAPPNAAMVEGNVLHEVVTGIILAAKRVIYRDGAECLPALENLPPPEPLGDDRLSAALREKIGVLWPFEHHRLLARVQEALAQQPHAGPDSLVALALPMTVEQKLNGTFLGLSAHLSVDACAVAEPMVMDLKFGRPERFHRLTTTGYALVMESLYEYPVSLGCIVYARFQDGRLVIERDFHIVDDELRQWFIEARDERGRLIEEEIDPGLPGECYTGCPYQAVCHPA